MPPRQTPPETRPIPVANAPGPDSFSGPDVSPVPTHPAPPSRIAENRPVTGSQSIRDAQGPESSATGPIAGLPQAPHNPQNLQQGSQPPPQQMIQPPVTAQRSLLPEPQVQQMPIRSALPDPSRISSQFEINPSIMVEEVPCLGTEMVARVGTQVILMGDLLPQLRRMALRVYNENLKQIPEEKRREITEEEKNHFLDSFVEVNYPGFLQEQILGTLIYNDFVMSKNREEREFHEKQVGNEFDEVDIPAMIKEFGVKDIVELKKHLKEELGSSIEKERMIMIRNKIAQMWILFSVKNAEGECTHDEMMEYYTQNIKQFESKAKTQWRELQVLFANHKTEKEAWSKIVWMGNQVLSGAPFEGIAELNSEGFTASKGGFWDWTSRGSLTSEELDNALFTLPEGKLSPIIKSKNGLHIVQVVKREEDRVTPFIEAQVTIRERIRAQRRNRYQEEYFGELRRKHPTIILRESIDLRAQRNEGVIR